MLWNSITFGQLLPEPLENYWYHIKITECVLKPDSLIDSWWYWFWDLEETDGRAEDNGKTSKEEWESEEPQEQVPLHNIWTWVSLVRLRLRSK